MEKYGLILPLWVMYASIGAVLSAPIAFFGRKRVHWHLWELLIFVLPVAVWTLLLYSDLSTGGKSLANLAEPVYLALGVPLAALVRVVVGARPSESACAAWLIAAMCAIAAGVFFIVPPLEE